MEVVNTIKNPYLAVSQHKNNRENFILFLREKEKKKVTSILKFSLLLVW